MLGNVEPFFLSILINGKTLKNCMIDSGGSNIVMHYEVMKQLGLKVDTTQGRCYAMDQIQVVVIGTQSALPYRLSSYLDKDLTISVLVVDIPPQYGILLSRKWSASVGGIPQCDQSYATFHIEDKLIKINREPKSVYMIKNNVEDEMTCFVDININVFEVEVLVLEKESAKPPIKVKVDLKSKK